MINALIRIISVVQDQSFHVIIRYPDEEAGQAPMAFVVKRAGSVVHESDIMDFIAKQVLISLFS